MNWAKLLALLADAAFFGSGTLIHVQGRGERRRVMAVRSGQDPAQWDSVTVRHAIVFDALLASVDR